MVERGGADGGRVDEALRQGAAVGVAAACGRWGTGLGGSGSQLPPWVRRVIRRSRTASAKGTPKVRVPLRMIWVPGVMRAGSTNRACLRGAWHFRGRDASGKHAVPSGDERSDPSVRADQRRAWCRVCRSGGHSERDKAFSLFSKRYSGHVIARKKASKASSSFLKKRTKKLLRALSRFYPVSPRQPSRSLLLLFFRKEGLACLAAGLEPSLSCWWGVRGCLSLQQPGFGGYVCVLE